MIKKKNKCLCETVSATGLPWVFELLALGHALSVSPIDNLLVLAPWQFDRACKHKDQQTIVFILFQWNTVFLWKGTYLDFEVAHVCVGGRSEEGRRVGRLV